MKLSPSLRGSGLKYILEVYLSTRKLSPSLRGSGLKFVSSSLTIILATSLPLYEGVDWNKINSKNAVIIYGLPLYEGVDWNFFRLFCFMVGNCLPLYEGVDWNRLRQILLQSLAVSLFTREWIEMTVMPLIRLAILLSPSLRGSGLKLLLMSKSHCNTGRSPSLRGSGLKWHRCHRCRSVSSVSLFTREWIEIGIKATSSKRTPSPSLRGSGLKSLRWSCRPLQPSVSLFTREWIEISDTPPFAKYGFVSLFTREWIEMHVFSANRTPSSCLPLYEGVDWNLSF